MTLTTKLSTRQRVLDSALVLFNARGILRVTTADIADAACINEGNLYYYFQRKEHLAEALFERFAADFVAVAETPLAQPADPLSYEAYQRAWFGLMWDYRFFYRDGPALRALAPALRDRMRLLNARGQQAVRLVFATMAAERLLAATHEDIAILVDNIWIVSAYWMDFRIMQGEAAEITQQDLAWGFTQVERLYRPYIAAAPERSREIV